MHCDEKRHRLGEDTACKACQMMQRDLRALEARVRAAQQALAERRSMSLSRLPSPEALPALRDRRHSAPAGSESPRPASPSQQQPPQRRASDPAGAAAAQLLTGLHRIAITLPGLLPAMSC